MLTKPNFGANIHNMEREIDFDMLGIYELREYARRCGVGSPTTKKRSQLIKEIRLIKEGKIQKVESNKGRPTKLVYLKTRDKFIKPDELYQYKIYVEEIKKEVDSFNQRINNLLEKFSN